MTSMSLTGPWRAVVTATESLGAGTFGAAIEAAVASEAMLMLKYVSEGFRNQGLVRKWDKLSPITMAIRQKLHGFGGSKALQVSGSLKRSVTAKKVGTHAYFVGVHRSVTGPKGRPLMNIAAIHEGPYPTLIPVTEKMRKFFMSLFLQGIIERPLKRSRKVLVIMPRPFLRPAFEKVKEGSQRRMIAKIQSFIKAGSFK